MHSLFFRLIRSAKRLNRYKFFSYWTSLSFANSPVIAVAIPAIMLIQLLCWMPSRISDPPAIDPKNEVLMFFNILFILLFFQLFNPYQDGNCTRYCTGTQENNICQFRYVLHSQQGKQNSAKCGNICGISLTLHLYLVHL